MNKVQKRIRLADRIVNGLIILCFLPLLLYGIYAVWDSAQVSKQADSALYEAYRPTNDDLSFAELRKLNPEVFGWLTVYGTHVDYPVAQGEDNTKYVNTDAKGNFSLSGCIFLDYRNDKHFADVNSILYGHHMEKNAMFGELEHFAKPKYFEKHKYGSLYYDGKWRGIEFFAFLHANAADPVLYNPKIGESEKQQYRSYLKENAVNYRQIDFARDDRYVALSTCTTESTNGRHILVGRLTDKPHANPFDGKNAADDREEKGDDMTGIKKLGKTGARLIGILALLLVFLLSHGSVIFAQETGEADGAAVGEKAEVVLPVTQTFAVKNAPPGSVETRSVYELAALDEAAPMPEGSADGRYTFALRGDSRRELTLTYSHGGVYRYRLCQVTPPGDDGYQYDRRVYTVSVYIINGTNGQLTPQVIAENEQGEKCANLLFANAYTGKGDPGGQNPGEEPPAENPGNQTPGLTPPAGHPDGSESPAVNPAGATANVRTGDDTPVAVWVAVLALATAGIAGAFLYKRRNNQKK